MATRDQVFRAEIYALLRAETQLSPGEIDQLAATILREGSASKDLVTRLMTSKSGTLSLDRARAAIMTLREILYGRRDGLSAAYRPGYLVTVWFRLPLIWPPGDDRTEWELLQAFPRLDLSVRLTEAAEYSALLEVDLYLPFPAGEWSKKRGTVSRIAADAANMDAPVRVESVKPIRHSRNATSFEANQPTLMNKNAGRRTSAE